MKLDYLQFLELEVFSRFGTQLEPAMARKIQRGRVLRELLKQHQRDAVTPVAEIAWLIAYNDSLLDDVPVAQVGGVQQALIRRAQDSGLTLNDPRERWVEQVRQWCPEAVSESKAVTAHEQPAGASAPAQTAEQ